jgi:hypothetical protein
MPLNLHRQPTISVAMDSSFSVSHQGSQYLAVPQLHRTRRDSTASNASSLSVNSAASGGSAANSTVPAPGFHYTYAHPPVPRYPLLEPPDGTALGTFLVTMRGLKTMWNPFSNTLKVENVGQAGYAAANAAHTGGTSASRRLRAVDKFIKGTRSPVAAAGAVYQVSKHWGAYSKSRHDQANSLMYEALHDKAVIFDPLHREHHISVQLMTLAMEEVVKAMEAKRNFPLFSLGIAQLHVFTDKMKTSIIDGGTGDKLHRLQEKLRAMPVPASGIENNGMSLPPNIQIRNCKVKKDILVQKFENLPVVLPLYTPAEHLPPQYTASSDRSA